MSELIAQLREWKQAFARLSAAVVAARPCRHP